MLLRYARIPAQYLPVKTTKELARKSWEATGDKKMSQLVGWVMTTLRMRGQRVSALVLWTAAGGGGVYVVQGQHVFMPTALPTDEA